MENATQLLHRLTSYEPGREWDQPIDDPRVRQDLEVNNIERLPWFYKRYVENLPRVLLPRDLPTTNDSAIAVMAGTANVAHRDLDMAQLSRLLHLCAGVVRTMERPYGTYLFRAAGSAGGRFPLELYIAIPDGPEVSDGSDRSDRSDIPAGVHWYDPREHALVRIGPPPSGAPALIVTGVPWRTGWRYRERGYRHIFWDAGTALAQLLALADSAGLTADLYTEFPDSTITALVGADGINEFPVAVVSLGASVTALEPNGPSAIGSIDAAPIEFDLVSDAHRAGVRETFGVPHGRGASIDETIHETIDPLRTATVEQVVLSRGSQRRMDPSRSVSPQVLLTSMHLAMRGVDLPHFVVVHAVDGMASGLYRWPDMKTPIRLGELRDELYFVSLEQALARDAAFVVVSATRVDLLNEREYRDAQLMAGIVEGRLHLLAYALGACASGMTFLDSEIPALLGEQMEALLFTCVGVADYQSAIGGMPGSPTEVRRVVGRE